MSITNEENIAFYIGELIHDADEKGWYKCEKDNKRNGQHTFEQNLQECGISVLTCINCNISYELD